MRKLLLMLAPLGFMVGPYCIRSNGQSNSESGKQAAKERISITISVKEATFKAGDPITLQIVVKNISEYQYCEHSIVETNHAEWNDYNVEVRDSEGTEVPRISKPLLPLRERPELSASRGLLCIAPGDSFTEGLIPNQIADMSQPGTYLVQIVHRDRGTNTQVSSNVIGLTVTH